MSVPQDPSCSHSYGYTSFSPLPPWPKLLATTYLFSTSITKSRILDKWSQTVCILVCKASFTQRNYFETIYLRHLYCGGGNGNPLQYSCLENPMDQGVWWTTVCRVAKSRTWLGDWAHLYCACINYSILLSLSVHWMDIPQFVNLSADEHLECF